MRIWACILLALIVTACDRDDATLPTSKPAPVTGVDVSSVTPLPTHRITHLAATRQGALFWVQEAESGREMVFVLGEGGIPAVTALSNAAIAQALGQTGAEGNIQSLAAGNDGQLYFYFSGGKGKRLLAAMGSFSPQTSRIRIISDGTALMTLSDMGNSLALARGSVLVGGSNGEALSLWLRHEDGYALLSLDLRTPQATLARAISRIQAGGQEIQLRSPQEDLAAGPGSTLLYLDRKAQQIWKIAPTGEAAAAGDVSDLPAGITAPSFDAQGRLVLFAPEEAPPPDDFSMLPTTRKSIYPALVIFDGTKRTILNRTVFSAPARFNTRTLLLNQLLRDRGSFLAYDTPSGELLRLAVVER